MFSFRKIKKSDNKRACLPISRGFTLIELLIVIAIIGILASVVIVSLVVAREKARDAKRLKEIKSIQSALEVYFLQNGRYPDGELPNWDIGNQISPFIPLLATYIGRTLSVDPTAIGGNGYFYYRYPAGTSGCPAGKGAFYVLGINRLESGRSPNSPGWACPLRNWVTEGTFIQGWVTGKFEN